MTLRRFSAAACLAAALTAGAGSRGEDPRRGLSSAFCLSPACAENSAELGFDELYSSQSARGAVFSEKLKSLAGRRVSMTGFMAPPLTPTIRFFVLTAEPMSICPFCGSDADWPVDIVVVKPQKPLQALPFDHAIKVTGTLELGSQIDEETGFVSLIRLRADRLEVL